MDRSQHQVLAIGAISLGLLVPASAWAAQLTQVPRGTWGASGVPDYVNMYIYVPDAQADNPPIVVGCHSCGTPATGYFNSISGVVAAADRTGFILILPEATNRNCWDVGTTQSLSHDGGGDTQAIVQMVDYVLSQYNGDASRVYVMGGSSGAMMTQALLAVYPDVFKAGAARAGVPAGCWADGFDPGQQWSNNCAGGRTTKTDQQWGDLVRGMYPGYDGPRPRVQIFHGTADTTINYNNFDESVKEWTNVLGLSSTPTTTDSVTTPNATYSRQFWEDDCGYVVFEAWAGQNGSHSMPYEEDAILAFFGLEQAGGPDPQAAACSGEGGTGGAEGTGGDTGNGGTGSEGGAPAGGSGSDSAGGTSGGGGNTGGTSDSGGGSPASGQSSCVPGVDTGDACDPTIDTETCVRSTRDCVCGADGQWTCTDSSGGSGGGANTGGDANTGGSESTGGASGVGASVNTGATGNPGTIAPSDTGGAGGLGGGAAAGATAGTTSGGAPVTGTPGVVAGSPATGGAPSAGQTGTLPSSGAGPAASTGGMPPTVGPQTGGGPNGLAGPTGGLVGTPYPASPAAGSSEGDTEGCSCRTAGGRDERGALGMALSLLTGMVVGRRRRRAACPRPSCSSRGH